MDRQEAKAKAELLWGAKGHIFDRVEDGKDTDWGNELRYWVGNAPKNQIELMQLERLGWFSGNGDSWEEAFEDAKEVYLGA